MLVISQDVWNWVMDGMQILLQELVLAATSCSPTLCPLQTILPGNF